MSTLVFAIGGGGEVELEVDTVAVGVARNDMPGLMRRSAETGRAFLIKNAKTQGGPSALLVDEAVLREKVAQARPARTLGQLLDALPFRRLGQNPVFVVDALPFDGLPELRLPDVDSAAAGTHQRRNNQRSMQG